MKIYSKEHEKALKLKENMDLTFQKHLNHINSYDDIVKKAKTPEVKKRVISAWEAREKKFENKEDVEYADYYNHMHKNFDNETIEKKLIKYKDGFVDKKFINDMFKSKARADKKQKRSVKKWVQKTL